MKITELVKVVFLMVLPLVLFYPLFTAEYVYTDEIVQLFLYRKGSNFMMFLPQGRYVTEYLFRWLFSAVETIHDISKIRLFSLSGWILCIPVWYVILKNVLKREGLPSVLAFFTTLYLIASPPFSISVQWASCLEQFLANTCGLLSGFMFYSNIADDNGRVRIPAWALGISGMLAIVSLFTYQNGFGCFFIPLVIHLLGKKRISNTLMAVVIASLVFYLVYYLLFKFSLSSYHADPGSRTGLYIDPLRKLAFFFKKPMATAFHFTLLFNEHSIAGFIIYATLFGFWLVFTYRRLPFISARNKLVFIFAMCSLFVLIYLPCLIVYESYSSNRTLFALNLAVFLVFFEMVFALLQTRKAITIATASLSLLFLVNSWYNFRYEFLYPIEHEYQLLRSEIQGGYTEKVKEVFFIRPAEDLYVHKYGIVRSWDEFGVPCSFFDWVPESLCRQLVYEKTGDRKLAEKLQVKSWLGTSAWLASGKIASDSTMVVRAANVINDTNQVSRR